MKKNILLVTPPLGSPEPLFGLLLIEESLNNHGHNVDTFDANLDLYTQFSEHPEWENMKIWSKNFGNHEKSTGKLHEFLHMLFDRWANIISSKNSDIVGISVFTIEHRIWVGWICYYLKKYNSDICIFLGGRGLSSPGQSYAEFGEYCINWQLADYYLNGESENEIIKFFDGTSEYVNVPDDFFINDDLNHASFTRWNPENFSKYQIVSKWHADFENPEHSRIDVSEWKQHNVLTATRGCVKRCTFCDVHLMRPKFSMRDPKNIAEEIIYVYEKYGINFNYFTDEMINGSNKQFMQWLEILAEYISKHNIEGEITWKSQFGIKKQRSTPLEMFDLLKVTGARLSIGIDHFSNTVLKHMKKLYTQDDIFYYLDNLNSRSVQIHPMLLIIGYPTETFEDFDEFKKCLKRLKNFKNTVNYVELGRTCSIPVGSELMSLSGMHMGNSQHDWYYEKNPVLTNKEKWRRRSECEDILQKIGIPISIHTMNHLIKHD